MVLCADMLLAETAANDRDGKRVTITVYQGSNPDPSRPGVEVHTFCNRPTGISPMENSGFFPRG